MIRRCVFWAILISYSAGAWAANTCEQRANALQTSLQRPAGQWDDAYAQGATQSLIDLLVQCVLWEPTFYQELKTMLPDKQPAVRVTVAGALRTPYAGDDGIVFPAEYLRYLAAVGAIVGHDVYQTVSSQSEDVNRPLLTTPFRNSQILPLIYPQDAIADPGGFAPIQIYLSCPAANRFCQLLVEQATTSIIMFALSHELSHLALHHVITDEGVNVEQEIAADKHAQAILGKFASMQYGQFSPEVRKELEFAVRVAPMAWLEVETSRRGITNVVAQARLEALKSPLTGDEKEEVEDLIEPERSVNSVARLQVTVAERPTVLLIDGISFDPASIVGENVLVTNEKHVVIGVRPGELAVARSDRATVDHTIRLTLAFNAMQPLDLSATKKAFDGHDWIAVLARTSDEHIQPRAPEVAMYHWEALHRLHLDSLIIPANWGEIPAADWRRVLGWQQLGKPLGTWY